MQRLVLTLEFLALVACGLPARFEAMGTSPIEGRFAVAPPSAPAAPALPILTPCPVGWRLVEGPAVACEPWPSTGRAACLDGTAHFPGGAACEPLGEPCPTDGWPTRLPADRPIIYVRAGATPGDGTRALPFSTLQQALANRGGSVIALAPGDYEAPTQPLLSMTVLIGACTAQTRLSLSESNPSPATVLTNEGGVELRQLTVTGVGVGVAAAGARAHLKLEDVIIERATGVGVRVEGGARATGLRVVIRDTQARPDGTLGVGVNVVDGSALELDRASITGSASAGLFVFGANSSAALSQTAVAANRSTGVWVNEGAAVTLSAGVVEDNRDTGVLAQSRSTTQLTDVVVRRTAVAGNGTGQHLWIDGATLRAQRLHLDDARALGVGAQNAAVVEIEDLLGERDFGVGANAGARIVITRALLNDTTGTAFNARLTGSTLVLADATVLDPRPGAGAFSGSGLSVIRGARVEATRIRIIRARGVATSVDLAGSRLVLTDASVEETGVGGAGDLGSSLTVLRGASLVAERVRLTGGVTVGVALFGQGTSAMVTDLHVEGISPPQSEGGLWGTGIAIGEGVRFEGTRVRVAEVHDCGLLVDGSGAVVTLTDATVLGTSMKCLGNPACQQRVAVGVASQGGARVTLGRFQVASNGGIGVQVSDTAQLELSDGWVGFHDIGANVIPQDYDVEKLSKNVAYVRNAQRLAAQNLPLPTLPTVPQL